MKEYWWSGTACHLWRAYFAMTSANIQFSTQSNRKKYELCNPIYLSLSERDQAIVRAYFTSKWGEAVRSIEDYSAQSGIPMRHVYAVISSILRAVIEADLLIDKYPEGKGSETR